MNRSRISPLAFVLLAPFCIPAFAQQKAEPAKAPASACLRHVYKSPVLIP